MNQSYQGDIVIIQIKEPKVDWQPLKETLVVAEGETTGHKHTLQVKDREALVEIAKDEKGYFVRVNQGEAELTHQQHQTHIIPQGTWYITGQYEYDELEELRRVQD